jgi:hypothetical protein
MRREGAYKGRDAEWNHIEAEPIAAAREGRVLNPVKPIGRWPSDQRNYYAYSC